MILPFNEQLTVKHNVRLITHQGQVGRNITRGSRVYITRSAYPQFAKDITPHRRAYAQYIKVGQASNYERDCIGYLPIAYINIPSEYPQARITAGSYAQTKVAEFISNQPGTEILYISQMGSNNKSDIVFKYEGVRYSIEVKSRSSDKGPLTLLPYTPLYRNQPHEYLDAVARYCSDGTVYTINQLIAYYRDKDIRVGFSGDEGVTATRSGSVRNYIRTTTPTALTFIRSQIINHYKALDNDFIAFYNYSNNEIAIHSLTEVELFASTPLPTPSKFVLDTYGGSTSCGAMRLVGRVTI